MVLCAEGSRHGGSKLVKSPGLKVLIVLVVVLWLISEFGPAEASAPASICGIGVAAIAMVKLAGAAKKDNRR